MTLSPAGVENSRAKRGSHCPVAHSRSGKRQHVEPRRPVPGPGHCSRSTPWLPFPCECQHTRDAEPAEMDQLLWRGAQSYPQALDPLALEHLGSWREPGLRVHPRWASPLPCTPVSLIFCVLKGRVCWQRFSNMKHLQADSRICHPLVRFYSRFICKWICLAFTLRWGSRANFILPP